MTKAVVAITQAKQALAEAKTFDEVKAVRDIAEGAKQWARARGLGIESENEAAEVVLRAERRLGEYLIHLQETGGRAVVGRAPGVQGGYPVSSTGQVNPPTLHELIQARNEATSRAYAAQFQRIARIPQDVFDGMIAEARAAQARISKVNFYRPADQNRSAKQADSKRTEEDRDFDALRDGAYGLLGWTTDPDTGEGEATRNGLLTLPTDELAQLAVILKALVVAYQEAKAQR